MHMQAADYTIEEQQFRATVHDHKYAEPPPENPKGRACTCGSWEFYCASSYCGHVYQTLDAACGFTMSDDSATTDYCKGTAGRQMISRAKVLAWCSACSRRRDGQLERDMITAMRGCLKS